MIGGKGGGGGGGGDVQAPPAQNTVSVTRPPPYIEAYIPPLLQEASEVAGRPHNPYPGETVAPLNQFHDYALNYGGQAMQNLLGPAAAGVANLAGGGWSSTNPFARPTGKGAPPVPGGPAPGPGPGGQSSAVPPVELPRHTPAGPAPDANRFSSNRPAEEETPRQGGGYFDYRGGNPDPDFSGPTISLDQQNQVLNLPYGTPLSDSGGQAIVRPGQNNGPIRSYATDRPMTQQEYFALIDLEDQWGGNNN